MFRRGRGGLPRGRHAALSPPPSSFGMALDRSRAPMSCFGLSTSDTAKVTDIRTTYQSLGDAVDVSSALGRCPFRCPLRLWLTVDETAEHAVASSKHDVAKGEDVARGRTQRTATVGVAEHGSSA